MWAFFILRHYLPTTMVYPFPAWALYSVFKNLIPEMKKLWKNEKIMKKTINNNTNKLNIFENVKK